MAEALARQMLPGPVKVGSAGINPLGYVAEETLMVLEEAGIPTGGLLSKGLSDINLAEFPLLVNLTAYSMEACLPRDFHGRIFHHPVADPFGSSVQVYRKVREAIRRFILEDLPSLFPHP